MKKRRSRYSRQRLWLQIIGCVVLFFIVGGGIYAISAYNSATPTVDLKEETIERVKMEERTEKINTPKKKPFSVLLLGVDERAGDKGRSDTIIVLGVNPNDESIKMLSIPRDTRTEIIGRNVEDKINHAYAFGDVNMSVATVENFLDIPIDYYIQINMEGFKDIVEAVGGVTITNDHDFSYGGHHFPEGEITLNGAEALAFSQMRKEDPLGDFGRQKRQRMIIEGVINNTNFTSLTYNIPMLEIIEQNTRTNVTIYELLEMESSYIPGTYDITQIELTGTNTMIDGISFVIISEEEKLRVQNELKKQLELTDADTGV